METSGGGQHADDIIPHQDQVEEVAGDVVDDKLEDASSQGVLTDLVAITGGESPTEAEHNAVRTRVNVLTQVLRDAGLIPTA
jgi:hypothetical protein